ncbi:MAG TPA: hypothetical protein PK752_23260 [Accumulibacter sp.]|uniref:hypothetical protein n=1 Tax=Accumulibacter sp. TaxID=2053492 RepID=UPI002B6930E1|nr:hypothetical protein [Accumulibacter sp.]HRD91148.1 hypothetical protein [Accumulibacter sp.]
MSSSVAPRRVLTGSRGLRAVDGQGHRRLDDPDDRVRLEIEESVQRSRLRVVPLSSRRD